MAENKYFEQVTLDGVFPAERVAGDGYTGEWLDSTIAMGQSSAVEVVDIIMQSESTCQSLMNENNTDVGIGYYHTTSTGHYYTIDYGAGG